MRRTVRGSLAVVIAIATVAGATSAADADKHRPLPTKQQVADAEADVARKAGDVASIRAALVVARTRLEEAAQKAEVASEAYNGAQWRLGQAREEVATTRAAADAASARAAEQRAALGALAAESFQEGAALSSMTAFLDPGSPEEIGQRINAAQSAATSLEARYDEYQAQDALAKAARERAEAAERKQVGLVAEAGRLRDLAAGAAQDAQAQAASIAVQRRQLIARLAAAQKISVTLAARRQAGLERIAQEKAAAAAAAAAAKARAEAEQKRREAEKAAKNDGAPAVGTPSRPSDPAPPAPPAAGSAARAIAFARAQLGEPYRWAASGPSAWDCSGLTMMAWRSGGVSLPHYSAAQYEQTRHISVGDLRPGDLVFWGDSPGSIHHVALYLGNGQILHAPRTGRPVSIDSMYYWVPPNYFGRP